MRLLAVLPLLLLFPHAYGQGDKTGNTAKPEAQGIAEKTKGLTFRPGLIGSYLDPKSGKAYLRFPPPDKDGKIGEYLYVESLATGLGSNDLGLDRTQLGDTFVLDVRSLGGKVLFEVPNLQYRSSSKDPDEQRAVTEGFGTSVLFAEKPAAQDPDGSTLVEISDFLVRDAHDVESKLKSNGRGSYRMDKERSVLDSAACKAFPNNLEFQSLLTFVTSDPIPAVAQHVPDGHAVTLTQRISIVKLPDNDYKPRPYDPRSGSFSIDYMDFSAPLGDPLVKMFTTRFRLQKVDPTAAKSKVKKPIVYYVDRGVPQPVRQALIEGGNYWKKAFEEAGFIDAYKVEEMPEGIDPLDARYNVVQWMNRSTRGYAYGQPLIDPRTGEIIKGAVNLDSQRIRQDIMLFESLVGAEKTGTGSPDDPIQVSLQRTRQLAAHEIGHTLGFAHNFVASTYGGRGSVMDYPAPLIRAQGNTLDFSEAYAKGVGDWDIFAVKYAYSEFPDLAKERAELDRYMSEALAKGTILLTDADTNDAAGANPLSSRFDNLDNPLADLDNAMKVRQTGLLHFGPHNLKQGQPLALLELVLGPLYFYHRYDVDAVAKLIGGVYYTHRVNGDLQAPHKAVPGEVQRQALARLLDCTDPAFLELDPKIVQLLGPWPPGYPSSDERFATQSGNLFDPFTAAASAADLVISRLLVPSRLARTATQHTQDPLVPGPDEVLGGITARLMAEPKGSDVQKTIARGTQRAYITRLEDLAASDSTVAVVSAANEELRKISAVLFQRGSSSVAAEAAHANTLTAEIQRFLTRPLTDAKRAASPPPALPGAPIGQCSWGGY